MAEVQEGLRQAMFGGEKRIIIFSVRQTVFDVVFAPPSLPVLFH